MRSDEFMPFSKGISAKLNPTGSTIESEPALAIPLSAPATVIPPAHFCSYIDLYLKVKVHIVYQLINL